VSFQKHPPRGGERGLHDIGTPSPTPSSASSPSSSSSAPSSTIKASGSPNSYP
jgi:hypothetical protein